MKQLLFTLIIAFAATFAASAQQAQGEQKQQRRLAVYGVAFYNIENLFDTIHAPGKNDFEFLPGGSYKWNSMKYRSKLHRISTVLSQLCTDHRLPGASVIGLSECENRAVLEDLLRQPELKGRGYRILHYESQDRRGVECAMMYNPRFFQLEDSLYVPYIYPEAGHEADTPLGFTQAPDGTITPLPLYGDTTHITRGFLVGIGRLAGERLAVIVNHWPSRGAESPARERAGRQVRALCDALYKRYGGDVKMIVMGDLNDDPDNLSMTEGMRCKFEAGKLTGADDFFNPWYYTLRKQGQGTLLYDNKWNLFDQILMSGNMVNRDYSLKKQPKPSTLDLSGGLTFWRHAIFMPDYLLQKEGKYKVSPLRTTAGGVWLDGYSDHLPTQVYLIKEL